MVKVGDKVTKNDGDTVHIVTDIAFYSPHDCTYAYLDGMTRESMSGWDFNSLTIVSDEAELETLRAFKADALTRFPDLAKPETDEAAAVRFGTIIDNDPNYTSGDCVSTIAAAIAWARANPR